MRSKTTTAWARHAIALLSLSIPTLTTEPASGAAATLVGGITFVVQGKVEFVAEYPSHHSAFGQVPTGRTAVPYLRVCAWRLAGDRVDFETTDHPARYGDDTQIGCTRTDVDGSYSITGTASAGAVRSRIYLATSLCDDAYAGSRSAADVCVRVNAPEGNESAPDNLKIIWSRVQTLDHLSSMQSFPLSWNLSCPDRDGLGLPSVSCDGNELEPDGWANQCPCTGYGGEDHCPTACTSGNCGDTNSRTGCNKEAVHAFRAAIEPYKTWGSNKPNDGSTFAKSKTGFSSRFCDEDSCQDEANFHLARVLTTPVTTKSGQPCDPAASNNGAMDFDDICIVTPMNPFRVVHELGHVIDMRWRWDDAGHGCAGADFDESVCERTAMREGFANFTATAAWFNAGDANPRYCGDTSCQEMESASALTSCGSIECSEGRMSQFFWDLRDEANDSGHEDDAERWTYQQIRNVLSAFPYGTSDTETREGRVDLDGDKAWDSGYAVGANAWDYSYHWSRKRGVSSGYCDVMKISCADQQEKCSSCASICR